MILRALAALLVLPAAVPSSGGGGVDGWAATNGGTTGGAGGTVYVVHDRAELIDAFKNGGDPAGPKVVLVKGTIYGNEAADGTLLGEQDYAPGYDINQYMSCFVDGTTWSDGAFPYCKAMRQLRQTGSNAEKAQIQIAVPSNTTLAGLGHARLDGVYLSINLTRNIIVRNLTIESPIDYFTSWSPDDTASGSWNARFDAFSMVTGSNVWVDHCTFTDGGYPDSEAPMGFHGKTVQRHDGLLDMEDGTDFVTVSYNVFENHDKALMVGSGDGKGDRDRGHLRMTFHHNLFKNVQQRSPRFRFGQLHTYNNLFVGSPNDPGYPMVSPALGGSHYFIGMGIESKIVSEYNVFRYDTRVDPADITVGNLNGWQFTDHGSWVNGRPADLDAVAKRHFDKAAAAAQAAAAAAGTEVPAWATMQYTTNVGWAPADEYGYQTQRSATAITQTVLRDAGAR